MAITTETNEALTPLAASSRVFRWHDNLSLWFSLGVGLVFTFVLAWFTRQAAAGGPSALAQSRG